MNWPLKFVSTQLARPRGLFGRFVTSGWMERNNVEMNHQTIACLDLGPDDDLLEIGFGSGYLLKTVLEKDLCQTVSGVDLSEEMTRMVCKRLSPFMPLRVGTVCSADIERLPFSDGQFSRACSVNTLYFWKCPLRALTECRRILRDGGRLVLAFDSKESLLRWSAQNHGFSAYTPDEVESMLKASGYAVMSMKGSLNRRNEKFYSVTGLAT